MEYTEIPNLDQKVSRIGLGTWAIGGSLWGGTDERAAIATILEALHKGINLIDTAPGYGNGASEKTVGQALKQYGKREKVIVATKAGLHIAEKSVTRDSRKASLQKEIEDSLHRLQVDYIDIYQIHWPDPLTPIAETAEFMHKLLQQGKIRAIGVSNFSVEQMDEFRKVAPLHVLQTPFNIFESEIQHEILPYCVKHGIATLGYSSLCRGLLSGKMSKKREFQGDDLRKNMDPKFQEPQFSEYLASAEALEHWAKNRRHPLPALAVRWVLDSKIDVALWGARKPDQLTEINSVMGWKLTLSDFEEIAQILNNSIKHPVGPEFMAPPLRKG